MTHTSRRSLRVGATRYDATSACTCLEHSIAQGSSLDEGTLYDGMRVAAARYATTQDTLRPPLCRRALARALTCDCVLSLLRACGCCSGHIELGEALFKVAQDNQYAVGAALLNSMLMVSRPPPSCQDAPPRPAPAALSVGPRVAARLAHPPPLLRVWCRGRCTRWREIWWRLFAW